MPFDTQKAEINAWRYVLSAAQDHGDRERLAGAVRHCDGNIPDFVRAELADFLVIANVPRAPKSKWRGRRATPARRFADQVRILFNERYSGSGSPRRSRMDVYKDIAKVVPLSSETIRDIVERRKQFRGDS